MAAMEAGNARYHNGHQRQQSGPPLPASPTLTNPDMILPDFDYSRSDSPDLDIVGRDHSPLMMWKNTHAAAASADMHQLFAAAGSSSGVGLGGGQNHAFGPSGPLTPTTPIIYGNGTMLSDIGEVTEVESTHGRSPSSKIKAAGRRHGSLTRGKGGDAALTSSPTMGMAALVQKAKQKLDATRERRASIESNSTITTEDQARLFADFDDTASVGDSVFQGDDEESMASSYVEGTAALDPTRLGFTKTGSTDRLSTYSTTSLSRRAEEILANAKTRLTAMENNLTRVRSSLHHTAAYNSEGSATATHSRDGNGNSTTPNTPDHPLGHSRISSDIAMRNGLPYRVSAPRSQSALGAAGGYRQQQHHQQQQQGLVVSKSADQIREGMDEDNARPTYKINPASAIGPQPLTEDGIAQLEGTDTALQNSRLEAYLSPTQGGFSSEGSQRSSYQRPPSVVQMRDIKDQMKDLKGKISSLREQARADSLKRRSLQSLRTPSPFTHSQIDQWYAEPPSNQASQITIGTLPERNPWNGEEESVDEDVIADVALQLRGSALDEQLTPDHGGHVEHSEEIREEEEASYDSPITPVDEEGVVEEADDVSDMQTENGDVDGEVFEDAEDAISESGESLYHDSVQHQISHEDREDAFDYEHFFLHSAMGTMSRHRLERRGSVDSYTSEDSVETTRGPTNYDDSPATVYPRSRRNSSASVSTIETFATAEETRSRKSPMVPNDGFNPDGMFGESSRASSSRERSRSRSGSTATIKRPSFSAVRPATSNAIYTNTWADSDGSISSIPEEESGNPETRQNARYGNTRRPMSVSAYSSMHRPSVSSLESYGTNRSFPLVTKPRDNSNGILTPRESPDQELRNVSSTLTSEIGSVSERGKADGLPSEAQRIRAASAASVLGRNINTNSNEPLQALFREDKYLVDRLVASLGQCVLGLTENGRASTESRMYRRRIDKARRILEGLEPVDGEQT
ncbi:hypothetical protein QBC38DRAFT_22522 [Podospora fimiseda]|uniref:Uncharacterized protein n=1 Tax=Podospora fimiseda TaxID=252190 RepID=A0AAN7BXH6_9PEZI|nr:hypothetical protein QBC38DRAFT_22522 [Podospora fimiseda]